MIVYANVEKKEIVNAVCCWSYLVSVRLMFVVEHPFLIVTVWVNITNSLAIK